MASTVHLPDDTLIWDLHFSGLTVPCISAGLEIGLFDTLQDNPASCDDIIDGLKLNRRAVETLLPMLTNAGLLRKRGDLFHLTEAAEQCLCSNSPSYWGPVFVALANYPNQHQALMKRLKDPDSASDWRNAEGDRPSAGWSRGDIDPDTAKMVAKYMDAMAYVAARVAAQNMDLDGVTNFLDVGAGSGIYAIEVAKAYPDMTCTLLDLPTMCKEAKRLADRAGVADQIKLQPLDMLREEWPKGPDAAFFSNIFHDWDFPTCEMLAQKTFDMLPQGGKILIHEALFDDDHIGPPTVAGFSLYMVLGTKGQQFTFAELKAILEKVGFTSVESTQCHSYYSVVSATKP